MFLNLGEVILCRRHPLGSNSEFPLASRGICSRAVPYVGCMSPSNVEGLPTVGTLVGESSFWPSWPWQAMPCLIQWLLAHWRVEPGTSMAGCMADGILGLVAAHRWTGPGFRVACCGSQTMYFRYYYCFKFSETWVVIEEGYLIWLTFVSCKCLQIFQID